MIPEFNFIGFAPDDETRRKANLALERLLDIAPYGSIAVALLQKDEVSYQCAIEIYSKLGPFTARASDASPSDALEGVLRSLSKKMDRWKSMRRFSEPMNAIQTWNSNFVT